MSTPALSSNKDQAIQKLAETITKIRAGEVVGVTIITTSSDFAVSMETLFSPMPPDRSPG